MNAPHPPMLARRLVAEAGGTAFLLAAICGSATMAERLAAGNAAVALIAISLAVGAALLTLTLAFEDLSGAHFNPAVTLASALMRELHWREAGFYAASQVLGALLGLGVVSALFSDALALPRDMASLETRRVELAAAFGLVAVFASCRHARGAGAPYAVASYVIAAVWATGTVYFANPAVTLALASASLVPASGTEVAGTVLAQLAGAAAAAFVFQWLLGAQRTAPRGMAVVTLKTDLAREPVVSQAGTVAQIPSNESMPRRAIVDSAVA